ncbi:MAG: MOSC domain-containing protein [Candidatus Baltobacteraceae bacterium]
MNKVGEIVAIWSYPVKSLAPQPLQRTAVELGGIPGDRAEALFVESAHARQGKEYRGKENNRLHLTHATEDAVRLASERNVSVRVANEQEHYFDLGEISILFDAWLEQASSLVGYDLEPQRFRPNFFARALKDFPGRESSFTGMTLHIGDCALEVFRPIGRCATPTYDLKTGEPDPNVLRQIAQKRNNEMGIYCNVTRPGTITVGDVIRATLTTEATR